MGRDRDMQRFLIYQAAQNSHQSYSQQHTYEFFLDCGTANSYLTKELNLLYRPLPRFGVHAYLKFTRYQAKV